MADTWLESLKEGDEVVVTGWPRDRLATVTRATRTQVHVGLGGGCWKFRRADGREIGCGRFDTHYVVPSTPELRHRIAREGLALKLARIGPDRWRALSLETLEAITALIDGAPAHG